MPSEYMQRLRAPNGWLYKGVLYRSLRAVCEANGARFDSTYRRLRSNEPWTLEQAMFTAPYARRPLSEAESVVASMQSEITNMNPDTARATVKAIVRLGALYLKEFPNEE